MRTVSLIKQMNSPFLYLVCGGIILMVALICVLFLLRAYRTGLAIGMDAKKLRRVIVLSVSFSVLPSVGILLGVIALSGSLGVPWPWLRLSVVGALHYETQVAQAAAEAVVGGGLSAVQQSARAFSTVCLLMSVCIIWCTLFSALFGKRYADKIGGEKKDGKKSRLAGFGDYAMTAMFVGLISSYLGSYVGTLVSGNGRFQFTGSRLPLAVAAVGCAAMGGFLWLSEKKQLKWLESFSIAGSMLIAMASAILLRLAM